MAVSLTKLTGAYWSWQRGLRVELAVSLSLLELAERVRVAVSGAGCVPKLTGAGREG